MSGSFVEQGTLKKLIKTQEVCERISTLQITVIVALNSFAISPLISLGWIRHHLGLGYGSRDFYFPS